MEEQTTTTQTPQLVNDVTAPPKPLVDKNEEAVETNEFDNLGLDTLAFSNKVYSEDVPEEEPEKPKFKPNADDLVDEEVEKPDSQSSSEPKNDIVPPPAESTETPSNNSSTEPAESSSANSPTPTRLADDTVEQLAQVGVSASQMRQPVKKNNNKTLSIATIFAAMTVLIGVSVFAYISTQKNVKSNDSVKLPETLPASTGTDSAASNDSKPSATPVTPSTGTTVNPGSTTKPTDTAATPKPSTTIAP